MSYHFFGRVIWAMPKIDLFIQTLAMYINGMYYVCMYVCTMYINGMRRPWSGKLFWNPIDAAPE